MTSRNTFAGFRFALPAALLLLGATGHAHPGHSHEAGGIGWGLVHPFTGLDHLLAAFVVGMLAALWRRPSIIVVFLAAGLLGGFAGAAMGAFIGMEGALAASVFAFGLVLALHRNAARSVALAVVGIGAAVHGWAHGSEVATPLGLTGILLGTACIVAVGTAVSLAVRRMPRLVTGFGAAIAGAAFGILMGMI